MKDKICVITGANSGIGKETAIALANKGSHIVMICRNQEKGEMARQEIIKSTGNQNIDLLMADLSSLADIRQLAEKLKTKYNHIDILIHNAGSTFMKREINADGNEMTFAVNYLAVYELTMLTLPLLKAAPEGRIVIVSSALEAMGRINWDDINYDRRPYNIIASYAQSKLMLIIFTKELAKRLSDTHITVNVLHPGGVATNLGITNNNLFYKLVWKFIGWFMVSAKKGAETSVYLATSPEVSGITGKYWSSKKLRENNPAADTPGAGERLWKLSEQIVTK